MLTIQLQTIIISRAVSSHREQFRSIAYTLVSALLQEALGEEAGASSHRGVGYDRLVPGLGLGLWVWVRPE